MAHPYVHLCFIYIHSNLPFIWLDFMWQFLRKCLKWNQKLCSEINAPRCWGEDITEEYCKVYFPAELAYTMCPIKT